MDFFLKNIYDSNCSRKNCELNYKNMTRERKMMLSDLIISIKIDKYQTNHIFKPTKKNDINHSCKPTKITQFSLIIIITIVEDIDRRGQVGTKQTKQKHITKSTEKPMNRKSSNQNLCIQYIDGNAFKDAFIGFYTVFFFFWSFGTFSIGLHEIYPTHTHTHTFI